MPPFAVTPSCPLHPQSGCIVVVMPAVKSGGSVIKTVPVETQPLAVTVTVTGLALPPKFEIAEVVPPTDHA